MARTNRYAEDRMWLVIVMTMLIAIIGFGAYSLISGKPLTIIEVVLAALVLKVGTMIDYRYGSSSGSKEKTQLLASEQEPEGDGPRPVITGFQDKGGDK